jgi:hypothetical protein
MKKILFCLFITGATYAQNSSGISNYRYGYNGMELIANCKKGTIIVSTFNAKKQIKEEIAQKVYSLFMENKIRNNTSITIEGKEAHVTGKCKIQKKGTLTTVNFYYEKIFWFSGLTEIYRKTLG